MTACSSPTLLASALLSGTAIEKQDFPESQHGWAFVNSRKNDFLQLGHAHPESSEAWLANNQSQSWPSERRTGAHNAVLNKAGYTAATWNCSDVVADSSLPQGAVMPSSSPTLLASPPWSGNAPLEAPEAWLANNQSQSWPSERRTGAHNAAIRNAGYTASAWNCSDVVADSSLQQGAVMPLSSPTLLASPPWSETASHEDALASTTTTRQACPLCGLMHGKACRPGKRLRSIIKHEVLAENTIQDDVQRLHRYRDIAAEHGSYACALVICQGVFDSQQVSR
eukprot:TRINITY_DN4946_c1_g1_i1.p1 TRINITY_DN4946_c1_g1~~TRINITY_DN4946_c1_g1_i1.p1  ORF type:complete len:282 (+),score=50.86 TRINITY_DN4946_c1_g1_i1:55-900(+)